MNPFFITGLTDAEGSFSVSIKKNNSYKLGWSVNPVFTIGLHKKDLELLKLIQAYFGGVGNITRKVIMGSQKCMLSRSVPQNKS